MCKGDKRVKGKIYAYNSHYEINDYDLGDCIKLEKDLSTYDEIYHKVNPKFFYDEEERRLYIPRGYDYILLEEYFATFIDITNGSTDFKKVTFTVNTPPRNSVQKEAVRFLSGKNEYSIFKDSTQLVLSLPPGDGKTYCTISAISLLGYRSMIIVDTVNLKDQWKEKFLEYTNLPEKYIRDLKGADITKILNSRNPEKEMRGVVSVITTHATLQSYMNQCGVKSLSQLFSTLKIGIKVFDEAHQDIDNMLLIDYMSNVKKTIYLSATFARSDYVDDKVFQKSFNMVHKLRLVSEEKRRHVIYIPYIYRSKPSAIIRETVRGVKGFDKYKYTDYELSSGIFYDILKKFLYFFIEKHQIDGKIIILSSKKKSCDEILNIVQEFYPSRSSCAYYTGNKVDNFKDYNIICATPKMLGKGADIPGLRVMINLEPGRSTVNAAQLIGRLREYHAEKDTYYVEPIDKAFRNVYEMYKTRLDFFASIVKEIKTIDTTIIRY